MIELFPFALNAGEIFSPPNIFLIGIALFWMLFASIQDLRKREVENWWNFSLIVFVLAFRGFISINSGDYWPFVWGLVGLACGFVLANIFYYGRMFAGGDAKLLMALGAVLPLASSIEQNIQILLVFLGLFLIIGSVYGTGYSLTLTFLNMRGFIKEYSKIFRKYRKLIMVVELVLVVIFIIMMSLKLYLGDMLVALAAIAPILLVYAKAVENVCMMKLVNIRDLTVGDWLAKPLQIGKKKIMPDWEGLSEKELKLIQSKYHRKVMVKIGVPFVPVFFISFVILLILLSLGLLG